MKIELKIAGLTYDTLTGKFTAGAIGLVVGTNVMIQDVGDGDTMREAVDTALTKVIGHPGLHRDKA